MDGEKSTLTNENNWKTCKKYLITIIVLLFVVVACCVALLLSHLGSAEDNINTSTEVHSVLRLEIGNSSLDRLSIESVLNTGGVLVMNKNDMTTDEINTYGTVENFVASKGWYLVQAPDQSLNYYHQYFFYFVK